MLNQAIRVAGACAFAVLLAGTSTVARDAEPAVWTVPEEAALAELLGGPRDQRERWDVVPGLVILGSIMDFTGPDMTAGYRATDSTLTDEDALGLSVDLTRALEALTGGRITEFAGVTIERPAAGQTVTMFRRGEIVVGRFAGVHERAGTLGYGGRTARRGTITAAGVILDGTFDRDSNRRHVLRTHELGHALGYNHVESRPSVMNPRVGSDLTAFDRVAIELAHAETEITPRTPPASLARLQN